MKTTTKSTFNRFQARVSQYCWDHRDMVTQGMATVLTALASFLNATSLCCFPSYDSIAERGGINRSTVIRNIRRLVAAGIVIKTQEPLSGGGCRNVYKIAFITADFSAKTGWQTAPQSKVITRSSKKNNILHNRRRCSYLTSNQPVHTTDGKATGKQPLRNASAKHEKSGKALAQGFSWLKDFTYGENPFRKIYSPDRPNCYGSFATAWYGHADPSQPNDEWAIDGCMLKNAEIAEIRKNPIANALDFVGERDNRITRRALESRLHRLGEDRFVAELVRMMSERKSGKGDCWRCPARILTTRLDYCYFTELATAYGSVDESGHFQMNYAKAWSIAVGEENIPSIENIRQAA